MNQNNNTDTYDGEIDLRDLFRIIWSKKVLIGSITSIAAIFSVLYALNLPNLYSSSSLLAPTSQNDSMSSKLGGLSGLAGLAGVSLPSGNISNSQIAVKRIESFEFFSTYFLPNIELKNLIAVKSWSAKDNALTYDKSLYDASNDEWVRKVSYPKKVKPSDQEAFKDYKKLLSMTQDELTGLVYISIEHQSPVIAKKWLDIIIYNINESMRELDKKDARNSINFLNETSSTVKIQSIKDVVSKLLEAQMQTLMLASSNESYVFKTINAPIIPEDKSSPNRAIICILGSVLGLILSLLLVLIQHYRRDSKI